MNVSIFRKYNSEIVCVCVFVGREDKSMLISVYTTIILGTPASKAPQFKTVFSWMSVVIIKLDGFFRVVGDDDDDDGDILEIRTSISKLLLASLQ